MAIGIRRVTVEQPYTLSVLLTPQDSEVPTDPDSSTVTIGVTSLNGTVVVPPNTGTVRTGAGAYSFTMPPSPRPDSLVATWSYRVSNSVAATTTYVTVMGAHYVDLAEVRALDGIGSADVYPTAMLVEKRDDAESFFELATGTFWTPHYVRDVLDGDPNYRTAQQAAYRSLIDYIPTKRIMLRERFPRQLLSLNLAGYTVDASAQSGIATATSATSLTDASATRAINQDQGKTITVNGQSAVVQSNTATTWTVTGWPLGTPASNTPYSVPSTLATSYNLYPSGEVEAGMSVAAFPRGVDNVVVEYIAGRDSMPADLRLALKTYIRHLVLNTNARIPDRATSLTTEFGTFRIGQATPWDNPTGIDTVDSVLRRYGERIPAFA